MSDIELPLNLLAALRELIAQARQQASRSVNTIQVKPTGKSADTSSNLSRVAKPARPTANVC